MNDFHESLDAAVERARGGEVEADLAELATSLRWHFNCHAAEPDKSYASLGIGNAEIIVRRILAAAERRGAMAVVEAMRDAFPTGSYYDWIRTTISTVAARAAAEQTGGA